MIVLEAAHRIPPIEFGLFAGAILLALLVLVLVLLGGGRPHS